LTRPPDFDKLLDGVEDPDERARLERVHELLVQAGPPPELSPTLLTPPPASPRDLPWQRQRRMRPRTVLVAAGLVTAFLVGYLAAAPGDDRVGPAAGLKIARTVQLEGEGDATGAIGVGVRDEKGNWPMVVSVWGLDHLAGGDYYMLALTKKGKPVVTCGTFNVSGHQTTVRMVAAYNLKGFDGWVVLHYDAKRHDDTPVLRSKGV
jgi:hypothetical protein